MKIGSAAAALGRKVALPFAEKHLAEVGFDRGREAELGRERGRGLVRALQRRDVDRGDGFVLQALGEQLGLLERRPGRAAGRLAVDVAGTDGRDARAATRRGARAGSSWSPAGA